MSELRREGILVGALGYRLQRTSDRLIRSQEVWASWNRHSSGKSCCSDGSRNPISFGDGFFSDNPFLISINLSSFLSGMCNSISGSSSGNMSGTRLDRNNSNVRV